MDLEITLVRSLIGNKNTIRDAAKTIGLRRIGAKIVMPESKATRGQIQKLNHLIQVKSVESKSK